MSDRRGLSRAPPTDLVVGSAGEPRLDRFLAGALGISVVRARDAIAAGRVRVDGRRARKGDALSPGAHVCVAEDAASESPVPQADLPLVVLHEDQEVFVLDKPAGHPSHPLRPNERGTLANALRARFPECAAASADSRDGGLVHRLDTETSGAIAAARTPAAYRALRRAFGGREVDKRYLALVGGAPAEAGEIELPLSADPADDRRVVACGSATEARRRKARPALTRYRIIERLGRFALLEVQIVTGMRHQIRAHLAAVGAPVVGDLLYGGAAIGGLARQFLHARSLAFAHPSDMGQVAVVSPLPPDLEQMLASLRGVAD